MLHCIGLIEVLAISICGPSLLNIHFGYTTNWIEKNQALILWNFWPRPSQIIATFYDIMFGVALSLLLNQNSIMTKSCQDGIEEHTWVNFWCFLISILLLWKMFVILVLDIYHPSFIWYLMIDLRRLFALKMIRMFLMTLSMIC